jgi:AdoMet-dependent heme synthase
VSGYVFADAPLRVYWELTRACDLACRHCRAEAMHQRGPDELTTDECERVIRSLAQAGPPRPHLILTGGDPLKRPDLLHLVRFGVALGVGVSVAPSATVSLTHDAVQALKDAGVEAMSLSIDGPAAAEHDGLRGVLGCFGWTLVAAQRIVGAGIPLQINTLVSADTRPHLDTIGDLVATIGASRWSLFFLVSVGRGKTLRPLTAQECEWTLGWVMRNARRWPFVTTTTEAPHYRRLLIQTMRAAGRSAAEIQSSPVARGFGVRDGNGVMFIAANGDVAPSGFLPLVAGNVRRADPVAIYRDNPIFQSLRDPAAFSGRCGACTFHSVCGGSRARAWAASGDVLGEDPLCAWNPAAEASGPARRAASGAGLSGVAPAH